MFWLLLLAVAAVTAVYIRWKRRGIYKAYAELPIGIPAWPFVGHGYLFRGTNEDKMKAIQRMGRIAIKQRGLTSIWLAHRLYADNSENGLKTLLDMLIESSGGDKGYSDLELREEMMTIVMAGTDTSAVGSSFTALMLARHPEVQEKAYQELHEIFGDSDRPVTWEDLPKLKYLEVVIKESLRLYPPVPLIVREVLDDETNVVLPSGTHLVPGMALFVHIWATHRNCEYWGADADQFRPERFCEGPLEHPAQYIPFSYSLRNCAGSNYAMMSMKTNLARLLRRYRVLPPATLDAADMKKPLRVTFNVMMRDADNFQVRIERREKII